MALISAAVPGPWWTPLVYEHDCELPEGTRVKVPLGSSFRVGLVVKAAPPSGVKNLKKIASVIDATPVLPAELWRTLLWFGSTWFAGAGLAAKTLLPSRFLSDEPLAPAPADAGRTDGFSADYLYEPRDVCRYDKYVSLLTSSGAGTLVLFPEAAQAAVFWKRLPEELREKALLWPASNPAKQWQCWRTALAGGCSFIVGSQAASFAPLARLSRVIVDDECSGAWRTQKYPIFHCRSLLAARAGFAGAELLLGGRLPSSKAFLQCGGRGDEAAAAERLVFVDLHDSSKMAVEAVRDPLKISWPLVRETKKARAAGGWAFWLLDRKGYAGEIFCEECGSAIRCPRCGGAMRWQARSGRLSCLECGATLPVPEKCPSCGGRFLEGARPGLSALAEKASAALRHECGKVLCFDGEGDKLPSAGTLLKEYPRGAVLVGTRKLLTLADSLSPSLIGWLDADFEARGEDYDAKARAYAMLLESLWRGGAPERRIVVVQSRRPGKAWQTGLVRGWRSFWQAELRDRQEWELPPYVPMIKITMPSAAQEFAAKLDKLGAEYWASDENEREVWVRTKRFELLSRLLAPYFDIKNARKGFPAAVLYLD